MCKRNTRVRSRGDLLTALSRLLWSTVFFLCAGVGISSAQQFTFHQYGQQDGLSDLAVKCLLQDRAGFLWMCSENGLFRYDGTEFKRFADKDGIDDTEIHSAVEDSTGRLWVGTNHDLYVSEGLRFQPVRPAGQQLTIHLGSYIVPLGEGLLVIDKGQLLELQRSGDSARWRARPYLSSQQLVAQPALAHLGAVFVDRKQNVWLGCGAGICSLRHGQVDFWGPKQGVPPDVWRTWLVDRDGQLWARGRKHIAVLPVGAAYFVNRDSPHANLTADILNVPMVEDRDGRIITRSDTGLARWQQNRWEELAPANGIPTTEVASLLVDRDNAVWIGTSSHGVLRWLGYGAFESWTVGPGPQADQVWSVLRTRDHGLLMTTRSGCYRIAESSHQALPCRFEGMPKGEIQVSAQRADGSLWFGFATGELVRVDAGQRLAKRVANIAVMHKLFVDSADRLWICSNEGIHIVEPGSTQVQPMPLPRDVGEITDAVQDAKGAVWVATHSRGLMRWIAGQWSTLLIEDEHARAGFFSVTPDNDGWIWAAGTSHGLMHLHLKDDTHVDHAEWVSDPAVIDSAIFFTARDQRGWIWAGTNAGVAVFDGLSWRKFSQGDGLIWNDTNENSVLADTDGSVWVGTSGGLAHLIAPERLIAMSPLDLRITRATVGSAALSTADRGQPRELAWDGSALDLHLADLDYGEEHQIQLEVRLRGLSDDWFRTREHDLHYPGLAPGQYTFEARAVDPDHQRRSQLVSLIFEITPPWWQSLWFRLLMILAGIVLVACLWHWRLRKIEAQRLMLEQELRERKVLLERATRDSLTKLWNRTAILETLTREIDTAQRLSTPLAIALIDVDHFKRINDTYGHLVGDEVLRAIGQQLPGKLRGRDSLGRFGGEELLLIMPDASPQQPFLPVERLRRAITEIALSHEGSTIRVTASFGVAWLQPHERGSTGLLGRADAALYAAKYAGRDRVEYAATGT